MLLKSPDIKAGPAPMGRNPCGLHDTSLWQRPSETSTKNGGGISEHLTLFILLSEGFRTRGEKSKRRRSYWMRGGGRWRGSGGGVTDSPALTET